MEYETPEFHFLIVFKAIDKQNVGQQNIHLANLNKNFNVCNCVIRQEKKILTCFS